VYCEKIIISNLPRNDDVLDNNSDWPLDHHVIYLCA